MCSSHTRYTQDTLNFCSSHMRRHNLTLEVDFVRSKYTLSCQSHVDVKLGESRNGLSAIIQSSGIPWKTRRHDFKLDLLSYDACFRVALNNPLRVVHYHTIVIIAACFGNQLVVYLPHRPDRLLRIMYDKLRCA